MGNSAQAASGATFMQKTIAILGGIIAPIVVICIITRPLEQTTKKPAAKADVIENIKPIAKVEVAADEGSSVPKTGEQIVNQACAACHATGLMNSPKIGDGNAWSARIAQGYETLTKHAREGIRMMPARGGNPDLTDTEIAKAVAYMANQAGANFTPPEEPSPAK